MSSFQIAIAFYTVLEVISSSEPVDSRGPRVDVDLPNNTITLTVEEKSNVVDIWKLIITNVQDPKEVHVFLIPAEAPVQRILLPDGVLLEDARYTLIVKGLQDVDAEELPGTTFKVVCKTATGTKNSETGIYNYLQDCSGSLGEFITTL